MTGDRRDSVVLKGMQFHTRVGVLPHEEQLAQPVEVDVAVEVASGSGRMQVVDYSRIYDAVATVMRVPRIAFLEDVAERVAAEVLALDGVSAAAVAVRKPHVPLPGPLEYAEVSIVRRRGE